MQKTFKVDTASGPVEAAQHATFAHYIQGVQFRFVVTQMPGEHLPSVTHRASGKRVTSITVGDLSAALNDHKLAGKAALEAVIRRAGEARVRSVLAAAE
ncbi:hypothetical protein [Achromobacter sp. NFACC18-2]|uniref:hypothetical protein n=1 Tax=Achromobacter sp. NFACC18-2 TaxID=1564112 RepID=UPI0008B14EA1|nr:hypothetical protein [Achromobacter sp. NFACC18-2]SEJ85483.1 hypothetical protein SAMN03159494_03602 [Achromobacter sp. NFACC18-2]